METKYFFKPELIRKITSVYHRCKKRGYHHPYHIHAPYGHEIIYMDYGTMNITLNKESMLLKNGELLIIKGGVPHSLKGDNDVPFSYLNIMFRGNLPDSLFNHPITVDRKMRELLLQIKFESEFQETYCLEMMGGLLTVLAVLLIRQNSTAAQNIHANLSSNRLHYESDKVEKACEIIRQNYNIALKEEDVTNALHISASHLRLLLKKNTGKNFTTLLHEYRIEAAKHFILEENLTFSEIALRVGFETPAFFFKLFKRHTGMTPKEYAKSLG